MIGDEKVFLYIGEIELNVLHLNAPMMHTPVAVTHLSVEKEYVTA